MLTRRIIEGKRNNKNRKKRNSRTTDFEPLHIIALIITTVTLFLSYIYKSYWDSTEVWCHNIRCHH